jgi:hypothetical protein
LLAQALTVMTYAGHCHVEDDAMSCSERSKLCRESLLSIWQTNVVVLIWLLYVYHNLTVFSFVYDATESKYSLA